MKDYDSATLARLDAGAVDFIDAVTFFFDSGDLSLALGMRGQFDWTDSQLGTQTFYGTGGLISMDVPKSAFGSEASAITLSLAETYMPAGSDEPVNIFFEDEVRASIEGEAWQGRHAILSTFWLSAGGAIIERQTVDIRQMDDAPFDQQPGGPPTRRLVLERPEIAQRHIAGRTRNADFQRLVDPDDLSFEHVGATQSQTIIFGRRPQGKI